MILKTKCTKVLLPQKSNMLYVSVSSNLIQTMTLLELTDMSEAFNNVSLITYHIL